MFLLMPLFCIEVSISRVYINFAILHLLSRAIALEQSKTFNCDYSCLSMLNQTAVFFFKRASCVYDTRADAGLQVGTRD